MKTPSICCNVGEMETKAAATEIFERYINRLCALARSRLSNRMNRRIEAEDVVQSAYRSFFRRAGDHYVLEKTGRSLAVTRGDHDQ